MKDNAIEWLEMLKAKMKDTEFENYLAEAIKALKQTRWISVNERLPEIQQDVILTLRSGIDIGFRGATEPYFYCHGIEGHYVEPQNVLAWMPLPEVYSAESEGEE